MKSAIFSNEDIVHEAPVSLGAGNFEREGSICRLKNTKVADGLLKKAAQTTGQGVAVLRQG
ncbi:hypothetical protein [Bradyrhizobium monzae]|uniref:hypothetical protein n=1 Tax=Bradyrhizobium sp. Oc8 TaxID=2876780 RepID=UPI001F4174DD|nr:hypothetical protein [Bradyrhizobium sp. Oc8]